MRAAKPASFDTVDETIRSNHSETGFSQLKEDDGETLRSRNWPCQLQELTRKCIIHNLTQAAS